MLWGKYPAKMPNFIHQLSAHGYETAYTGKGWGPGANQADHEPTGKAFKKYLQKTSEADGYLGLKNY